MAKVRGTSSAPIVLGVVGGVLALPAAVCAGACATGAALITGVSAAEQIGIGILAFGIIGALLAIVFGALSRKIPKIAGLGLLAAFFIAIITTVLTLSLFSIIPAILMLIAAILSFAQKKEIINK